MLAMYNYNTKEQGLTLIELIVTIAITLLLLSSGYSSLQGYLMRQERALFLSDLKNTLAYARSRAFLDNTAFTLCGSLSKHKCHMQKDWSSGFILFENPKKDGLIDNTLILRTIPGVKYGKIYFTGPRGAVHIDGSGMTMSIGTFIYCPHPPFNTLEEIDGLVLNRVFRSYYLKDNPEKIEFFRDNPDKLGPMDCKLK